MGTGSENATALLAKIASFRENKSVQEPGRQKLKTKKEIRAVGINDILVRLSVGAA